MKTRRIVSLVSLGCPKNLVDSEGLVGTLLSNDFRVVANPKESDVVIVNTCGFLDASRKESLDAIRNAVALKSGTAVKRVLVAGCMVGNYRELLEQEAPGVDALVGFGDYHRIDRIVEDLVGDHAAPEFGAERRRVDAALTPRHYAYLKISEGCDHTCAFCVIPSIRGAMRSFPTEDLVDRARGLAERGVREINVVAQDSTVYGSDLYGELRLPSFSVASTTSKDSTGSAFSTRIQPKSRIPSSTFSRTASACCRGSTSRSNTRRTTSSRA